ncbi:MAG TPA: GNAT family N-acetyltransferase [Polyangiaceae bacterium]|nr:GNAT family N-acetyltransferase [Polyangiaceae bacterium]
MEASDSLQELTDLLHRAYATLGARGLNYTAVDQSVISTREQIARKECYLAFVGCRMVGTLLLGAAGPRQLDCEWYRRPGVWIIGRFAVEPALQGQGIGSQMLALAEQRARSQGALEAALDTAEGAEHLVELYEKRGYRRVGYVQWEGKSYRSLVLSKALTQAP